MVSFSHLACLVLPKSNAENHEFSFYATGPRHAYEDVILAGVLQRSQLHIHESDVQSEQCSGGSRDGHAPPFGGGVRKFLMSISQRIGRISRGYQIRTV